MKSEFDSQKLAKGAVKVAPKRKSTARAGSSKKVKKEKDSDTEEDDEDTEEDDEDGDEDDEEADEDEGDEDESNSEDGSSKSGPKKSTGQKKATPGKNQPDKDGYMDLYLFKNDLTKDYRNDEKLCMWRRDGASLLQKFLVVKDSSANLIFKGSSVYSCWEEKRKNDFFQIKVQLLGEKKESKVRVVDLKELEGFANEDRPKIDLTSKAADSTNVNDEE